MATHKYIYWRSDYPANGRGELFANVHLLVDPKKSQGTLTDFREMAEELRKTFPDAKDDEICGGRVIGSDSFEGHAIISWFANIPKADYPGWSQHEGRKFEYSW